MNIKNKDYSLDLLNFYEEIRKYAIYSPDAIYPTFMISKISKKQVKHRIKEIETFKNKLFDLKNLQEDLNKNSKNPKILSFLEKAIVNLEEVSLKLK